MAEATRPGTTWAGASGREQQTAGVGSALGPRRLSEPTKSLGLEGDLATPPSKARGQDALSGMLWAGWGRDEAGQRGRRPAGTSVAWAAAGGNGVNRAEDGRAECTALLAGSLGDSRAAPAPRQAGPGNQSGRSGARARGPGA